MTVAVDTAANPQVKIRPLRVRGVSLGNDFSPNTNLSSSRSQTPKLAWAMPPILPSALPREKEVSSSQKHRNGHSPFTSSAQSFESRTMSAETPKVASAELFCPSGVPVDVIDVWEDFEDEAPIAVSEDAKPIDALVTSQFALAPSPTPFEISPVQGRIRSTTGQLLRDILTQDRAADTTSVAKPKLVSTNDFFVTSRKIRVRKRCIVPGLVEKFLRRKRAATASSIAATDQQALESGVADLTRDSCPPSGFAFSEGHERDTDVSFTSKITIMDLPNEIIQVIAQHLRPIYEPIDEINGEMRVVIWEQDDGFDPLWGKDLFGLATSCKRFHTLLYDTNRFGRIQVADSEEALKSMVKNIPWSKRQLVKSIIIGNAIYVHEDAITPYYLDALAGFPNLKAIQHRLCDEMGAFRFPAVPFQYRPLDSLDIAVPDIMCETPFAPPAHFAVTTVKSLTLRECTWWMLYSELHTGPQGGRGKRYFDNLRRHFKGIERLNLFPVMIHQRDAFPDTDGFDGADKSGTWITQKNLPEVRAVNIRFDMTHKFRQEDAGSLSRLEHILTNFSPLLRHVKITLDLILPTAIVLFLADLRPPVKFMGPRGYRDYVTKHFIPTPERIQESACTLAKHIPALKTVEFLVYDHRSKVLPLFEYQCRVQRVWGSQSSQSGSFHLKESKMNRFHRLDARMIPEDFNM